MNTDGIRSSVVSVEVPVLPLLRRTARLLEMEFGKLGPLGRLV